MLLVYPAQHRRCVPCPVVQFHGSVQDFFLEGGGGGGGVVHGISILLIYRMYTGACYVFWFVLKIFIEMFWLLPVLHPNHTSMKL